MFFHQERGKRTKNMQTVSTRVKWLSMLLVYQSGLLRAMVFWNVRFQKYKLMFIEHLDQVCS